MTLVVNPNMTTLVGVLIWIVDAIMVLIINLPIALVHTVTVLYYYAGR